MDTLIFSSLQNVFHNVQTYFVSSRSEWMGRIVIKLKTGLTYLEDPRFASAALFFVNFGILELASRISRVVGLCLIERTETQKHLKSAFEITLASGLVVAGNVAFVRATGISVNPFIIAAIVTVTFITKFNLENYLETKPTLIDKA